MVRRQLCPRPARQATWVVGRGEDRSRQRLYLPERSGYRQDRIGTDAKAPQAMNINSIHEGTMGDKDDTRPILLAPYMGIGDLVRGHTGVRCRRHSRPNPRTDPPPTSLA